MATRKPLIVNPSAEQIQEIPSGDNLDGISTLTATTFVGNGTIPLGGIIMWSGNAGGTGVPTGWTLCDGNSGTAVNGITIPNLVDKFIIGAKQVDSGAWKTNVTSSLTASGGNKDSTLVSHSHTTNSTINPGDTNAKTLTGTFGNDPHSYTPTGVFSQTSQTFNEDQDQGSNGKVVTIDVTHRHGTDSQGSAATNTNLPPYYSLAYLIRTS